MHCYTNNKRILVSDRVKYADAYATVVYVSGENSDEVRNEWDSEIPDGILIEFDNGARLQLEDCHDDENLVFVMRKA